jgi:hypothetical protein
VAAHPRRRWRWRRCRRLPAAVAFSAVTGRVHVTVMVWHPATWLIAKRAFRPLAIHISNSAENSAAVMAVGGPVQVAFSTRVYTSPLPCSPMWGVKGGMGARRRDRQLAPSRPGWLAYDPKVGEAGWRGPWRDERHTALLLRPPTPAGGVGGGRWQGGRQSVGEEYFT